MAVGSSPRQSVKRAASHSTDVHFIADLITPVSCLLVLWGVLAAVLLSGAPDRVHWLGSAMRGHRALVGSTVLAGTGLLVVLVAALLMNRFARRVQREAEGRVAAAQRGAHEQAVAADAAEAALRNGFRQILASLGRRNQSLLHRQLRIIDTLEQQASSPAALAELFTLDHLTTRMRRHAESLTILSGAAPGRSWSGPVPIIDVMRAAAAEVEDYTRVTVISDAERGGGRHRRHRHDPPAGRADRERDAVLPVEHPGRGPGRAGRQRLRRRGNRPGPGHSRRPAARAQPPSWPSRWTSAWPTPTGSACSSPDGWPPGTASTSRSARRPTWAPRRSWCCRTPSSFPTPSDQGGYGEPPAGRIRPAQPARAAGALADRSDRIGTGRRPAAAVRPRPWRPGRPRRAVHGLPQRVRPDSQRRTTASARPQTLRRHPQARAGRGPHPRRRAQPRGLPAEQLAPEPGPAAARPAADRPGPPTRRWLCRRRR